MKGTHTVNRTNHSSTDRWLFGNLYLTNSPYTLSLSLCVCVCIPILVTTFPEWLSGTEPLPHTRRRASVLVVFELFSVHMHSFAGLIRRTPPPTFSDTEITDRHSDTTIFQLRAHWVRISWSIGSEKSFGHVSPVGVEPSYTGDLFHYYMLDESICHFRGIGSCHFYSVFFYGKSC